MIAEWPTAVVSGPKAGGRNRTFYNNKLKARGRIPVIRPPASETMAILDNHGGIYGKAGTVVYRRYRGMNIIQGLPKQQRKRSSASKAAALEFGLASTTAAEIRDAFQVAHRSLYDGGLINRCNSAVYRSILACRSKERGERDIHDGDVSFLEGLEFNNNSRFADLVKVKPEAGRNDAGQVVVKVPRIDGQRDIRAWVRGIEGGRYVLKFVLVAFNFREEFYEYVGIRQLTFFRSQSLEAQELVFDREVPPGCFLALTVSLSFEQKNLMENKWESLNSMEFNPGMVLAAFPTEGEAEKGYGKARTDREIAASKAEGRTCLTHELSRYQGKKLLEKMQKLLERKKKQGKKEKRMPAEEPEDPGALEGRRVKF